MSAVESNSHRGELSHVQIDMAPQKVDRSGPLAAREQSTDLTNSPQLLLEVSLQAV